MPAVALIDGQAHPAAAPFYRMFPFEPQGPGAELRIDTVRALQGFSLESLVSEIRDNVPASSDLMIVCHGNTMGLSIPLFSSNSNGVKGDHRAMSALDDANRSDAEVAQILLIPNPQSAGASRVRDFRAAIAAVKAKRLGCIELRACNIGNEQSTMQIIKRFFGASRLGAPDVRDSYAMLTPGRPVTDSRFWENWRRQHPRHKVYEVPAQGRVGLATSGGGTGQTSFQLHALVNSLSSVGFWADVYLARLHSAVRFTGGTLPIHSMWTSTPAFPLVFPGDDGYVGHVRHV